MKKYGQRVDDAKMNSSLIFRLLIDKISSAVYVVYTTCYLIEDDEQEDLNTRTNSFLICTPPPPPSSHPIEPFALAFYQHHVRYDVISLVMCPTVVP